MREGGPEKDAETLMRPLDANGGTRSDQGVEGRARAACDEKAGDETSRLMEEVLRRENLMAAYERVRRNKGAAGVDGMTVEELMPYCREHWDEIREQLYNGTYTPRPVRAVEIPKPNGGVRMLGIPVVVDRLIMQAVLQVLTPIIDPTFSESSYSYRLGRSAHEAVKSARKYVSEGYDWVVDLDLEKFLERASQYTSSDESSLKSLS